MFSPAVVGSPLLEGNLLVVVGVDRQTHQAGSGDGGGLGIVKMNSETLKSSLFGKDCN